jgi:hypothetical protein
MNMSPDAESFSISDPLTVSELEHICRTHNGDEKTFSSIRRPHA